MKLILSILVLSLTGCVNNAVSVNPENSDQNLTPTSEAPDVGPKVDIGAGGDGPDGN